MAGSVIAGSNSSYNLLMLVQHPLPALTSRVLLLLL